MTVPKGLTVYEVLKDTPHEFLSERFMKEFSLSFMPFNNPLNLHAQETTALRGNFNMCFMDLHKDAPKPSNHDDFYVYAFSHLGEVFGCSLRFRNKETVITTPLYPGTQRSINLLNSLVACSFLIQALFVGYNLHPQFCRGTILKDGSMIKTSFKMGDTYRVLVDTGKGIVDTDYRKLL